eukprot:g1488.t1
MGEGTDAAGTPAAAAVGAPTKSAPAVGARSSSPAEPEVEFVQTELPPAGIDGADPDPDYTATKLRKSSFKDTLGLGEKEIEFSDAVSNDGNGDSEKMDYANLAPASASAPVPPDEDMPRKSPKLGGVPVGEFETPVSDLDNSSDGGGGGSARALESGDQGMKRRKLLLEHETPHNVFAKRSSYPGIRSAQKYPAERMAARRVVPHQSEVVLPYKLKFGCACRRKESPLVRSIGSVTPVGRTLSAKLQSAGAGRRRRICIFVSIIIVVLVRSSACSSACASAACVVRFVKTGPAEFVRTRSTRPDLFERYRQPFESCDDCTALTHLDETSILQNLRLRYEKSQIYTSAAKVLLAVNPLAKSPAINDLYTTDRKKAYQEQMSSIHRGIRTVKETRPSCVPLKLAPHPYGMADAAYRQMLHDQQPQIVIISGVSGSGKTETAKITMGYLAYRSRSHEVEALEMAEKMLDCNPVLESFGNAATVRNCNSSRFGKYNALLFNVVGHLHSAEIRTFLLESSRVTNYASSERSYHVFYELLAAGGFGHGEFLSKRGIRWETSSYRIAREEDIGRGSPHCVFRRDDAANFKLLEQGLRGVKIDVSAVFEVLCGLIHLGEIDIISEEQNLASHALRLGNEENLDWAAKILGLDVSKLREVLTTKWVVIAGRDAYQVSRTQPQAIGLLHSLSKYLYRKLFDFIVAKVNVSLNRSSPPPPLSEPVQHPCQTQNKAESHQQHISPQVIGILDIYGFEQLEVNSFEQLCINLANEHLQQFFVDNVLRGEQELYRNEGLKWTAVTVPDCRACVTAITDCFKTLDDACFRVGRMAQKEVTAVTFTQSVHDKFKTAEKARNHGIVKEPKRGRGVAEKDSILRSEGFVVTHFAGDITYHTSGWLEKNNSRLESELEKLVGSSSSPVVLEFCAPFLGGAAAADASRASSGSSVAGSPDEPAGRSAVAAPTNFPKRPLARRGSSATLASFDSVSKKYLTDLSKLLQTLQEANLHYVRCFCPNAAQEPNLFDKSVVLNQMRESGTFQLVDIMHRGYPHRCDYKVLAKKFQSSLPEEYQQYDARTFIDLLMLAYDVPKCDYVMGISKLFLKSGKLAILQKLLAENASSEMSQDLRRYFTRKKQKRCFHAVRFCIFLKKFTRKCRQENLAHGLFVAARTFVRIARWHKRAQRRLAVADKQRQFARTVLLIAKLRAFVKKRLERIRIRERRLHILYRWSNFYVFNLRYIRRWRAEKERERKALAEQNVKFFAQICVIKLRLRQAVKGARDRIRRRAARRNIDALARFCLIKVQFSRKLRFLRLTKAEQERARKERAIETVRTFVQICKLQLKLRRLAAEARDRVRRRATERNLELVAGYVRMTVVVRRALRRRMRRKQAAQRAQEHWHTVFRHAVLPSIGIRWLNGKIKAFKLAKRAADAADGINLLVRHTNNVVRLKRAIARARRSLKTHHHLKTFGQHVMLCMALRRYLVNWRADRDKAKRVLLAQARLKTFAQHVVLCKAMLLYVRHWKAEKQRRKSIRAHAHLDTFARHAILSIALRRYIRNRRTSKNLISEAQERQAHERAKKQQRTEHLLTSWARGCLLAVHFRSFVHARRRLGARRIFAFLDKSAKTQRRRTALLSVLDAHRRKRRLGRMTLPKFDDIVCKLICLKRLIRRWKRRKDEQRKRKVRTKGLLDQFVRGVFVAIRLRRWLHAMQERLVLKQVDHHLARRENKQRLCTIVCGLVLLKRAVRQWALRKRRRKSVSVLLGKLCEAVRIIRSLKRWIRSFRASKNGNGTRNTRNAVAAAPAGGFAASSSLRIDFPEDDHQAAMLQQPCLFSTDLSDLSGCSIAARASGAVNNANASLVLVAPPPTLASAASGTTDLVQAEAAMATASSAAGGTIANNQSAISPEDLQHLMTRMQMLEQEVQSLGGEVRRSRSSRQLARSSTQALVIAGEEGEQEKLLPSSSSRVSENVARQGANGLMMVDAGAVDVVGGVEVDGVMHADGPGRDAALERTRTGGNIDVAMGERGLAGLEAGLEAMLKGIRGRGGPSPSGAAAGASATASSSSPAVDVEMHQGPRESLNGRQRLVAQSPSDFLHINCVEQCGAAGSPPVQGVSELHAAQNGSSAASSSLGSKATKHLHFPSSSKKSKSNSKKSSPKADSGTRSKRSSSGLLGVNFGHDSASKRIAANLAADNHQAGDTVAHSPVGPEGQHLHNYSDEAGEAEGDRDDMSAQHQQHLIVHADSSLVTGHAHGAFNFPEDLAEFEKQIQEASDDDSEDHREAEEEMNAGKIDAKLAAEKKYIKGNSFGSATLQQHMQRQKERRGAKSVPGIGRH